MLSIILCLNLSTRLLCDLNWFLKRFVTVAIKTWLECSLLLTCSDVFGLLFWSGILLSLQSWVTLSSEIIYIYFISFLQWSEMWVVSLLKGRWRILILLLSIGIYTTFVDRLNCTSCSAPSGIWTSRLSPFFGISEIIVSISLPGSFVLNICKNIGLQISCLSLVSIITTTCSIILGSFGLFSWWSITWVTIELFHFSFISALIFELNWSSCFLLTHLSC